MNRNRLNWMAFFLITIQFFVQFLIFQFNCSGDAHNKWEKKNSIPTIQKKNETKNTTTQFQWKCNENAM